MQIHPWELLDRERYTRLRPTYRRFVIGHEALRRVGLGSGTSARFESRETIIWQIHEALRPHAIWTGERIDRAIEAHADRLPGATTLMMTLMFDPDDLTEACRLSEAIRQADDAIVIRLGDRRLPGHLVDAAGGASSNTVRFDLEPDEIAAVGDFTQTMWLTLRGSPYYGMTPVSLLVRATLADDLRARSTLSTLVEAWRDPTSINPPAPSRTARRTVR